MQQEPQKASFNESMKKSPLRQMYEILLTKYPNFAKVWMDALETRPSAWEEELSFHIQRAFGQAPNAGWIEAVDGYAEFCTDALRAQVYFERYDRYPASDYAQVVQECYHDANYMKKRYLPGQYLSHFIWPHHYKMLSHYMYDLLPQIKSDVALFYEVGVGCGMYSLQTLMTIEMSKGVGYDISQFSSEFTSRLVEAHGLSSRYKTKTEDVFLDQQKPKADLVINQEVLEHLPDPAGFVAGLYGLVRPGGWGYISAAINAAHTDHIYLYRSVDEVKKHLEDAGWLIRDTQIECNYPEKPEKFRPTLAGFLVQRPL